MDYNNTLFWHWSSLCTIGAIAITIVGIFKRKSEDFD